MQLSLFLKHNKERNDNIIFADFSIPHNTKLNYAITEGLILTPEDFKTSHTSLHENNNYTNIE